MHRKNFIRCGLLAIASPLEVLAKPCFRLQAPVIMTVTGPIDAQSMGFTLTHEHILVDFIGVQPLMPRENLVKDVTRKAIPFLQEVSTAGCKTLVECTPAYLGRDAALMKQSALQTGLQIITNTGYYGAAGEKYIPKHAYTETADQIAARWVAEWENGIDGTGIKPGYIKSGVDKAPLSDVQKKLIEAACITHLKTGLTFGVHTGDGAAALEELNIIQRMRVSPEAWVWIHAQSEPDRNIHIQVAKQGGWVSFDGLSEGSVGDYVNFIKDMRTAGLLHKILISHDAGWYHLGYENGGSFRGFTTVFTHLVPELKKQGFSEEEINQVFVKNPAAALSISVKKDFSSAAEI